VLLYQIGRNVKCDCFDKPTQYHASYRCSINNPNYQAIVLLKSANTHFIWQTLKMGNAFSKCN